MFIDKQTQDRVRMDCQTETGKNDTNWSKEKDLVVSILVIPSHMTRMLRFESNMPLQQHKYYNQLLNDLVNKSQTRGEKIRYRHTRETDRFHPIPGSREKCRVTIDQQTGQVRKEDQG